MQDMHVRPRQVQFEDEVCVQNACSKSSTNIKNSSAKTVVNKTLSEDKCYECLAVGDDDDEDGGEVKEDDGARIDVADDPMGDSGPAGTYGACYSTNVTPTPSQET